MSVVCICSTRIRYVRDEACDADAQTFSSKDEHENRDQNQPPGMDVCVRKPLIVTAGADRTVRVWNYQDRSAELCKSFAEEPFAVAIHPNGFLVIVGFSDKLRLLNLIMEDLYQLQKCLGLEDCNL